jgi:galactose mutarotase-like enzyme
MFKVNQFYEQDLLFYELNDVAEETSITVVPERGGIITTFTKKGREILYLNKDTLFDCEANIRGGIPVLFPICGQLTNGEYQLDDKMYRMKNHGFARNQSWEVVQIGTNDSASITLSLKSNAETKQVFPFDFELIFTYSLVGSKLTISQEYRNFSDREMPIYAGFHPYFKTQHKDLVYQIKATEYIDYNDMKVKQINNGLGLADKKESLIIVDSSEPQIAFEIPELQSEITLNYGEEFKYVVLWTEAGKDFVCVEPWMAKNNAFNEGKSELVLIKPKASLHTHFSISC